MNESFWQRSLLVWSEHIVASLLVIALLIAFGEAHCSFGVDILLHRCFCYLLAVGKAHYYFGVDILLCRYYNSISTINSHWQGVVFVWSGPIVASLPYIVIGLVNPFWQGSPFVLLGT